MGQRCKVCSHSERARIELGIANKVSFAALGRKFLLSKDCVYRHRRDHMPPTLIASLVASISPTVVDLEALHKSESEGILQHLAAQRAHLWELTRTSEELGDNRAAVSAHGRIIDNLALSAKVTGQVSTHSQVVTNNLIVTPEYLTLRTDIMEALRDHPEARKAVSVALAKREGVEPHFDGLHSGPQIEHVEPVSN